MEFKKKVQVFKVDSFVDFENKTRQFVMAAVSLESKETNEKVVSIGISVCNAEDTFNEELGKTIASGKAVKKWEHAIIANDRGMLSASIINALLDQEVKYFKSNPGRYLAGYDRQKEKYLESQSKQEEDSVSSTGKGIKKLLSFK